jgi:hypothetical protein
MVEPQLTRRPARKSIQILFCFSLEVSSPLDSPAGTPTSSNDEQCHLARYVATWWDV